MNRISVSIVSIPLEFVSDIFSKMQISFYYYFSTPFSLDWKKKRLDEIEAFYKF
jgi:hypothetical protein